MDIRNLTPDERFDLVMECRRSGLTDHQWLKEHGIAPSTFYNWISKFRKNGYPNIPDPLHQHSPHKAQPQEVVRINVLPETAIMEQNAPIQPPYSNVEPVMEIICGRTTIRLTNDTDQRLLETVLRSLGGAL